MGSVYRPINRKGEPSPNWWLRYTANGKQHRENSRSTDRRVAERLLKQREGRAAAGQVVNPHADRVILISSTASKPGHATLAEDVVADYKVRGRRSLEKLEDVLKH